MTDEARNDEGPEVEMSMVDRVCDLLSLVNRKDEGSRPLAPKGITSSIHLLLDRLTESPGDFDDDAFGSLAEAFGTANAGAWCPCGTGATFGGCCKTRWLPAMRAWERYRKEGKSTKKDEIKHVRRQEGKDSVTWLGMIGIDKEKGALVAPCPGQEGYDLYALVAVLPGLLTTLLGMKIKNDIFMAMEEMGNKIKQGETQQGIIGGTGRA